MKKKLDAANENDAFDPIDDTDADTPFIDPDTDNASMLADAGPCPVQCLGHNDGRFYFVTPSGQLRDLVAKSLGNRQEITALMEQKAKWAGRAFPKFNKDGDYVGPDYPRTGEWLIMECAKKGIFSPDKVRGLGVWKDVRGGLIVHCGDKLMLSSGAKSIDAGAALDDGWVYPAQPPLPAQLRPAMFEPANTAQMKMVYDHIKSWNFLEPSGAQICLGIMGLICVCGALDRRPTLWLTGDAGMGKTELLKLLTQPIGGLDYTLRSSDASAAWARAALKGAARPIFLDEMEPGPRAAAAMELARLGFSSDQAGVGRASADQKAILQRITAQFVFGSILHPEPKPQDQTRIHFVEMTRLTPNAQQIAEFEAREAAIRDLGPRIWSRMILGYSRFLSNMLVYRGVLGASSYSRRMTDKFAPVLAAVETLLHDEVIDPAVAADQLSEWGLDTPEVNDSESDECLNHLMSCQVDTWRGGDRPTVGQMIEDILASMNGAVHEYDDGKRMAERILPAYGLRLAKDNDNAPGEFKWLLVANKHTALAKLFRDTRWQGGVHRQALSRIPGAINGDKSGRFGGGISRFVKIPLDILKGGGQDGDP
ncbi:MULTISPECIES: hypothetical protein [Thalassospira]|jgi:hypothetical protein|uniref:DNA primase/helicase n=1 Tax=Thalassospira xiamenensis TaxID=220697 RepID=A0ABR5XXM7_9PROT|nr:MULTISPECIES: hypothetical protein [Thalassospira]MBL4839378.1 hypothetical protein [Thalassospira sp.]KZC97187.1 hypothetical protein AUP40_04420 [Thalassospira xiamenensis]KZD10220.1 hypothetical protein AUP45_02790 [Thalassospira xiamenensis]MCD1593132.1 hypothetical protein [Thalassospira xiamenensis]PXX36264.1 hypothetical protein C7967_101657 [Thalassospira sp. 11-3]